MTLYGNHHWDATEWTTRRHIHHLEDEIAELPQGPAKEAKCIQLTTAKARLSIILYPTDQLHEDIAAMEVHIAETEAKLAQARLQDDALSHIEAERLAYNARKGREYVAKREAMLAKRGATYERG